MLNQPSVQQNAFLNYKISSKKLQFGVEKCKKLCIGKSHSELTCPDLTIDGWKEIVVKEIKTGEFKQKDILEGEDHMETVESEKYLGDIITDDGKNDKNIRARENKGWGIAKDLIATLVEMLAGTNHHTTGVTFRNTILISTMLNNAETWYNLTTVNIVNLEKVDEQMLRGILSAHRMTPRALLYLELGCLPVRYIIKSKRLMFLHYILSHREESLIKMFFNAQIEQSKNTDWTSQVQKDIKELKINLSFEDIKAMSKNMFRNHIKKKIEIEAVIYLKSQIKSKGKEIKYTKIEMQDYLTPESKLTVIEKQDIFKMRTRMLDIKENMKGKHSNFHCEACQLKGIKKRETQKHVYKCKNLNTKGRQIKYKEIFGRDTTKMKKVLNRINENLKNIKQLKTI